MTHVSGTTNRSAPWMATSVPSTAESTEIAGVMMPSPYKRPAPATAETAQAWAARFVSGFFACRTRAKSAKMPPSPSLSAFVMKPRYFTQMTLVSDQKNSESTPSTLS